MVLLTIVTEFFMQREEGEGGGVCVYVGGGESKHFVLCKKFIIMFALQDHLPLDRIITRFSAPTTIMQFQHSSLDGILIELAWLVTHGVNDNIFCLSGLIECAGGEDRGRADTLRQAMHKE